VKRNRILNQIGVIFVTCLLTILSSQLVYAACTGSSPTWTTTPDYTSVQTCVTSASSGDKINITAESGSATWPANAVTVPAGKNLIINGPGTANLTINITGYFALTFENNASRVTNLAFVSPLDSKYTAIQVKGQGWRVDHCSYHSIESMSSTTAGEFVNANSLNETVQPFGLVDNNIIVNGKVVVNGGNNSNAESAAWVDNLNLGTAEAVYVEDNNFSSDTTYRKLVMDADRGGKYVFRYNTTTKSWVLAHGLQADTDRATRKWEIYGNTFQYAAGGSKVAMQMKGGTGVIFNDDITSPTDPWNGGVDLYHERDITSPLMPIAGICDGTSGWDENTVGQGGWLCRDQVGADKDASQWASVYASNLPAPVQTKTPAYFWSIMDGTTIKAATKVNNQAVTVVKNRDYYEPPTTYAVFDGTVGVGCGTLANRPGTCTTGVAYWSTNQSCTDMSGMVGAHPSTPIEGTLYKCNASGEWEAYYTPYTYPHPLRGEGETQSPSTLLVTSTNGTVTSNPAGINCGSTCSVNYDSGKAVALTASANSGYTFTGWSGGGCSGTGACTVSMTATTSVTANFATTAYNLTVTKSGTGSGTVTGSDGLVNCGSTCSVNYDSGKAVALTALANSGSVFSGWSGGGCSGTGTCTVSMTAATSVAATFIPVYNLTVTESVAGAGTITSSDRTMNCGSTCSGNYDPGTSETLTASANSGYTFTGWLGGGCSGTGTCTVSMAAATSVTATFATSVYNLAVTKSGTGAGTVTGRDGLVNCGSTCSVNYESGKSVTLAASPTGSSTFSGWSGACSGKGACTVTMIAAKTARATFNTSLRKTKVRR
jgi:hypothetical protein